MKNCIMKNKFILVITILFNVISSAAAIFVAKLLQKVTDAAISIDFNAFKKILLISIGYILLLGILYYFYSLFSKRLIRNMTRLLRQRLFYGIFRRNVQDFTSVNTADYISAFTNDIKIIEENFFLPALLTLQYSVMFIVTLILLFQISPLITLILILCVLLMLILPGLMAKSLQTRQEILSRKLSDFTCRLKDYFSGYEIIKSFQMKHHIEKKFEDENWETANVKFRADKLFVLNESISTILAYFAQFTGLFIGTYLIIRGRITAGTLIALIQLSGTFVSPIMMILQNIPRMKSAEPVIKRIDDLSNYADITLTGTNIPTFQESIEIKNLSFSYDDNQPVLKNTNLSIQKNRKYAIIGQSGCGKSTLGKLLTGSYGAYEGSISFDGIELHKLSIEKLQQMISVIHQNIFMFDESIEENIYLFDTFSKQELSEALSKSGVALFLEKVPAGLSSPVGENGSLLSGGQRQRVAIARALIRKKPILILDEGTSAVDLQTAYDIESKLLAIKELTLITITHNLSEDILGMYDQIIYMENGSIAEAGSLRELLMKQGRFYKFVNLQK